MVKRRNLLAASAAVLSPIPILLPSAVLAQAPSRYPERAIRLVVPFAPGGDGDVMGRLWVKYATQLAPDHSIIVDNKAGAGGVLGATEVARAKPDGYTLLLGTTTTQIINPLASGNPPYNPVKDFVLIGMVSANPTCVVVNPSLPVNSLAELTAYAKNNKLSYGSAGQGTITNLTGELYKYLAGKLDIQHIPYKGGGPAMQDLIAGHVPLITPIMSSAVLAQHRAGKARILAVNSPTRLKAAPDIPTATESGMPQLRVQVFNAVFAPASTPKSVIDTLRSLGQRTLLDKGFLQDIEKSGAEVLQVADHEKFLQEEVARWTQIIQLTQFKME